MFWFLFSITSYWYVFFKLQYRVTILLPKEHTWELNYSYFDVNTYKTIIIYNIILKYYYYQLDHIWISSLYDDHFYYLQNIFSV